MRVIALREGSVGEAGFAPVLFPFSCGVWGPGCCEDGQAPTTSAAEQVPQ